MRAIYKPIRILIVLGGIDRGGAQSVVMDYYRWIDKHKIQFDFVIHSLNKGDYESEIKEMGGNIWHIPSFKIYNIFDYIRIWKRLLKEHHNYRAIHAHMASTACFFIPFAKKYGIKTIVHAHSSFDTGNFINRMLKKFSFYLLRYMADYFFACSNKAGIFRFGKKILKNPKYKIWYNAIDISKFSYSIDARCQVRDRYHISADSIVIGNVGRLTYPKNHKFLFKIFQNFTHRHPNARLLLVGDGDLKNQLIDSAKKMNIINKIIFTGSVSNVSDYLSAMDVFVFPSLWEGLPVSVIEAQVSGLYCIVSSNITQSVKVSQHIEFDDLTDGSARWSEKIEKIPILDRMHYKFTNQNYNILQAAKKAEKFYLSV